MGVAWRTEMKGCLGRAAPYPYPFVDESHATRPCFDPLTLIFFATTYGKPFLCLT